MRFTITIYKQTTPPSSEPAPDEYTTADIALASYLHMEGFQLTFVDESRFPTKFLFKNDTIELAKCINLWERAKAEGNLFQFYRSYKAMISKIKDGNSGRSGGRGR